MAINKKKNKQVLITLTHEMIKEIEFYKELNSIKNTSEAIRNLIKKGLESN